MAANLAANSIYPSGSVWVVQFHPPRADDLLCCPLFLSIPLAHCLTDGSFPPFDQVLAETITTEGGEEGGGKKKRSPPSLSSASFSRKKKQATDTDTATTLRCTHIRSGDDCERVIAVRESTSLLRTRCYDCFLLPPPLCHFRSSTTYHICRKRASEMRIAVGTHAALQGLTRLESFEPSGWERRQWNFRGNPKTRTISPPPPLGQE